MQMQVEYCKFSSKRRFGVELEVSNTQTKERMRDIISEVSSKKVIVSDWAQSNHNNYWHVKRDSTCGPLGKGRDNGWEIASYIASGYKDLSHISKVADALCVNGVEVTKNCGMHIHVDISDFSPENAAVLVAQWVKIERILVESVPEYRRKSKYCCLLNDIAKNKFDLEKKYDAEQFWRLVRPTNFQVHDNNQKKVALNMVHYAASIVGSGNRPTVELRLPEGTLNGDDIKNWARLFIHFVELSRLAPMPENISAVSLSELMVILGLEDDKNFYILSKGLYETKVWLLRRLVLYSNMPEADAKLKIIQEVDR